MAGWLGSSQSVHLAAAGWAPSRLPRWQAAKCLKGRKVPDSWAAKPSRSTRLNHSCREGCHGKGWEIRAFGTGAAPTLPAGQQAVTLRHPA